MLRPAFEGVVLQVPSNVEVGVESGELTLTFSNFSGDVSVRPQAQISGRAGDGAGGKRIALSQAAGSTPSSPTAGGARSKTAGRAARRRRRRGDARAARLAGTSCATRRRPTAASRAGRGLGLLAQRRPAEPGGRVRAGRGVGRAVRQPAPAAAAAAAAASAAAFDAAKTDDEDDDDDDAPAGGGVGERLGEATQVGHEATQVGRTPSRTRRRRLPARRRRPPSAPPPPPPPRRRRLRSPRARATAAEWTKVKPKGEAPPPRWRTRRSASAARCSSSAATPSTTTATARSPTSGTTARGGSKKCADAPQPRWTRRHRRRRDEREAMLVCGGDAEGEGRAAGALTMVSYDPEYDVWYEAVDCGHRPTARAGHSAVLHHAHGAGQKLVVFGGVGSSGRRFAEPELHESTSALTGAAARACRQAAVPARAHTCTAPGGGRLLSSAATTSRSRSSSRPRPRDDELGAPRRRRRRRPRRAHRPRRRLPRRRPRPRPRRLGLRRRRRGQGLPRRRVRPRHADVGVDEARAWRRRRRASATPSSPSTPPSPAAARPPSCSAAAPTNALGDLYVLAPKAARPGERTGRVDAVVEP